MENVTSKRLWFRSGPYAGETIEEVAKKDLHELAETANASFEWKKDNLGSEYFVSGQKTIEEILLGSGKYQMYNGKFYLTPKAKDARHQEISENVYFVRNRFHRGQKDLVLTVISKPVFESCPYFKIAKTDRLGIVLRLPVDAPDSLEGKKVEVEIKEFNHRYFFGEIVTENYKVIE